MRRIATRVPFLLLFFAGGTARAAEPDSAVSVLGDPEPGPGARHGMEKIRAALKAKGLATDRADSLDEATVVAGLGSGSGHAARLLASERIEPPDGPEALLIRKVRHEDRQIVLIVGSDDRGLMYAELDVAGRIAWAADPRRPFEAVHNTREKPYVSERALSKYTMHRGSFESYFHDESYWSRYLDLLARSRFSTFVLIFGYENAGYFAPPYPYFFDVEGYPDVRVVELSPAEQKRNLASLNRLIEMTHDRGLDFTIGMSDHIYRGGVQGPSEFAKRPTPGLVWGVTADNLVAYTKSALVSFLREVRGLDAIQFRMHGESGLKRSEMAAFWTDVYRIVKKHAPGVRFDARAKNYPDSLIETALDEKLEFRITTKYWMEQMGLPFHPTHVHPRNQHDRRHGYADLLRYPRRYPIHWRLWSGGTVRALLWGDPDYVRRFAESTHLYDGEGFEINEPMATKMQDHPHALPPFDLLRPEYRYYDWEFERYWHFFQVWGRVAYSPDTPAEIWRREFERRLGKEAAPHVERALHRASQILPRIVAYSYPYRHFPTTRGWVEKQRQCDLPVYAKALPSDTEQFQSIDDAARCRLEGDLSAKVHPAASSRWFERASADVLGRVARAEEGAGGAPNRELVSTLTDLRILAHLAAYHSSRARSGLSWALHARSGDVNALDDAIHLEGEAVSAWRKVVAAAGEVYTDDLMMGRRSAGLSGHWRDELASLENGLEKLRADRRAFRAATSEDGPTIVHIPVRRARPGATIDVRATVGSAAPIKRVSVVRLGADGKGVEWGTMVEGAPFVFRTTVSLPPDEGERLYYIEAEDNEGRVTTFPPAGPAAAIRMQLTGDRQPPSVTHRPVRIALASRPLRIALEVRDPSGVSWVRLRYRSVTQFEDYRTAPMKKRESGQDTYEVTVPAAHVDPAWDFMYFFEVLDGAGNGSIYPDLEKETPYIVVELER